MLSNSATFGYDALGRLTAVTNSPNLNATYGYDTLGNMNLKEGTTLAYSPSPGTTQPHVLAQINGSSTGISSDPNGNRTGKPTQGYGYNLDDRLETVTVGSATVQPRYDYTGRQVLKVVGASTTRYYSELAEGQDGYLTKHYFAAGLRIASQRVQNSQLAALSPNPAVQLADVSNLRPAVVVLLRKDVCTGLMLSVTLLGTALLLAPWRRKRVIGIAVRQGHVVAVIVGFTLGTLPWPLIFGESVVQAQTAGTIYHYHVDHLGSTQVITDGTTVLGAILQQVRYKPYGEERYRTGSSTNKYEFTGYETDATSNLEYAGARFYDPALGMFLTHDPVRQFGNPYAYGPWNPVNGTDPSGAAWWVDVTIGLSLGPINAPAYEAGRKGGFVAGVRAGAASLTSQGAPPGTSYGLNLIWPDMFGKPNTSEYAYSTIPIGGTAYGTVRNLKNGNYATGAIGAASTVVSIVFLALGIYGIYSRLAAQGESAQAGGAGGNQYASELTLNDASGPGYSDETLARIELGETESVYGPVNQDALSQAQTDIAHVLMNREAAGETLGWPGTADPRAVTGANQSLYGHALSAVRAARAEQAAGLDPTGGALHFNMRSTWSQAPFQGNPLVHQYGPFFNDLSQFTMRPYGLEGGGLRTWLYINIYK